MRPRKGSKGHQRANAQVTDAMKKPATSLAEISIWQPSDNNRIQRHGICCRYLVRFL
jgi:hypothetical protein